MPRHWDDWEKIKAKHRHGRHDWSRPGRFDAAREAAREVREAVRAQRSAGKRRGRELSPEEEAYVEARRAAERKIKFFQHLISYVLVVLFLYFLPGGKFFAPIVGLGWGIGLASHFFQAIVAPDLRKKWVKTEVERQVARSVSRERISLEELSASIAHEIRNPITAAKSLVQQLGEDPGSTDNVEYAQTALAELDRVERSISHLLRYAREEEMNARQMKLVDAIESGLETVRERIDGGKVEVRRDFDVPGELIGDPGQLRRVFINLVGNALDAFAEAGTRDPVLEIAVGENLGGSEVWARVKDNGPGIDADTQARIFKPFFTSKANGTGLGLAITRKLVDQHGGQIEVQSAPGQGCEFTVHFPKQAVAPQSARTTEPPR